MKKVTLSDGVTIVNLHTDISEATECEICGGQLSSPQDFGEKTIFQCLGNCVHQNSTRRETFYTKTGKRLILSEAERYK